MNAPQEGTAGATGAQEAFLEKIRVRCAGFATYLGCGNEAEDIAQETVLVLLTRYGAVAGPEDLLKLGIRICANLALNWRRNKSNPVRTEELPETMADSSQPDPESAVRQKQLQELMLKAIRESGRRCKEMLRLRMAGAPTKEIASRLQMTPAAVDTAYFRCQQRLRDALKGTR